MVTKSFGAAFRIHGRKIVRSAFTCGTFAAPLRRVSNFKAELKLTLGRVLVSTRAHIRHLSSLGSGDGSPPNGESAVCVSLYYLFTLIVRACALMIDGEKR